ncbi:hypothetical protein [Thalassovita sp.]|uniref:hypothetical protein n=1 Tax=Thalassovita sp. TaxID=1979401 RepID=UPI0028819B2B|nr:hypothetical protein [Thalassovita sp.]MDF1802109.1 hypothetical protein [Thalassovita sp.]
MQKMNFKYLAGSVSALCLTAAAAHADQVFNDDVIVDGSLCVGMDCVNGEVFGFDTIRLKENNVRIKFDDTSSSGSFPNNDWQLTANDSTNGGANKFSIDDITNSKTPFTVEANSPNNTLYVDSAGRIGVKTAAPVVDIHVVNGNTPTLRLEQDGSSGFGAQTWDVAANETNFFVRDASNGSRLPFKIRPGASTNSVYIDAEGDVGLSTASPDAQLHVVGTAAGSLLVDNGDGGASSYFAHFRTNGGTSGTPAVMIEDTTATSGIRRLLELSNNGGVSIVMQNNNSNVRWALVNQNSATNSAFLINNADANGTSPELKLENNGDLTILGNFISGGTTLNVPDYVFEDDYELLSLSEVEDFIDANGHLPKIPSAKEIGANGINISEMQMALLEKVEELTLYTLEQQDQISALKGELEALKAN